MTAIVGATAVTMGADSLIPNATVLIRDGRIAAVGPVSAVRVPRGATRVDGRGKWVIPGLSDMHTHLYADEYVPDSVAPFELGVMLANGVTVARIMIGSPLHQQLRARVGRGEFPGPQLWVASPQFTGKAEPMSMRVRTADEASKAVEEVARQGYEFIKLTTDIAPEVFEAIVNGARRNKLPIVGHVDPRVGVRAALAAGMHIEHLDNYMESVLADSAPSRVSVSDVGVYRPQNWATIDHIDDRKVDQIAGETARAGVFVDPTLAFFRLFFATPATEAEIRARPDYAHIPPKMRDLYMRAHTSYWRTAPSEARRARYIATRNRLVKAIVDSGGKIMAGSDGPGGLMGYGWTLHRELQMLVDAGLSPYQALAAATTVPAQFLRAENEIGRIAPGMRADLVLLNANPLADIRNTTRIDGVAMGGRFYNRAALDTMISEAGRRLNPSP